MAGDTNNEPGVTPGGAGPVKSSSGTPPDTIGNFMQQLKHDRFIKIYIGEDISQEPYLVPQSVLAESSQYFLKAIENEQKLGNKPGVLHFPEDGDVLQAWGTMLYWIVNKYLPLGLAKHCILVFVECWVLGDKYLLPKLQNAIMVELVRHFEEAPLPIDSNLVNTLLQRSPVDTALRRLVSEETVHIIYAEVPDSSEPGKRLNSSDLMTSDGVVGLSSSLLDAFQAFIANGKRFRRLEDEHGKKLQTYKQYLVSEDPKSSGHSGK